MRSRIGLLVIGVVLISHVAAVAAEAPVAVSPGDTSKLATIESRCPTFSWDGVDGAVAHELVVYRVGEEGQEAQPILRRKTPGSASSWTPSLAFCLERGGQYAWSVRGVGRKEASNWSAPSLFEVATGPSEAEFEAAVELVQTYLGVGEDGAARATEITESQLAGRSVSGEASSPAVSPPGTQLSVDGNVDASSYSGVGTLLTNLDPANLSPGTAGIDVSGTAANVTGTVAVGNGGTGASDASGAREKLGAAAQADLNTHTASGAHDALTISGLDCTANANGGALTVNASGVVSCSNDDTGSIAPDSLDFDDLADVLTVDATTKLDLDTKAVDLIIDKSTLFIDSSANRVGIGTTSPAGSLHVGGSGGDASVILPSNAIGPGELFGELGVASDVITTGKTLTSSKSTDIAGRSITAPTSGHVLALGSANLFNANALLHTTASLKVTWSQTGKETPAYGSRIEAIGSEQVDVLGLFSVPAGFHTFFLSGRTAALDISASKARLILLFISTTYGTTEVDD